MSEKDKESKKLFGNLSDEGTEEVSADAVEKSDGAEKSDWEFEASAKSLENDFLTSEGNGDFQVEFEDDADQNTEEDKTPDKDSDSIHISKKSIKITLIAVAALIVAAVVAFVGYWYFAVPNSDERMTPGNVALKIGNTDVSIGMYNYYYSDTVYQYTAYASYGDYDIDLNSDFATQYTTDDDGNQISWLEFFDQKTKETLQLYMYYYEKGVAAGIELTDEQKKSIDDQIATLEANAAQSNQSIDEYISENYAEYCGEATLRKISEQSYIAGTYYYQSEIYDRPTEDEVNQYLAENEDSCKSVGYAFMGVPCDTTDETTIATSIQSAQEISETLTDVDSLKAAIPEYSEEMAMNYVNAGRYLTVDEAIAAITKSCEQTQRQSVVENTFSAEVAEWLFSDDTEVFSTMVYPDEYRGVIYIIMKASDPVLDESEVYSVRHILITPESAEETADTSEDLTDDAVLENDEDVIDETADEATIDETADEATDDGAEAEDSDSQAWEDAYAQAKSIVDEYNSTDKKEIDFAKLAEEYSEDTESTTNGSSGLYGGFYEGVDLGAMVPEFESWATDGSRRYGDVDIVKSDYGYHIMYFVEQTQKYVIYARQDCFEKKENDGVDALTVKEKLGFKKVNSAKPGDKMVYSGSTGY